jgi:DNA-binding response OmpR family regulator
MPTVAISAAPGSEEKGFVTVEVGGDTASVEVRGSAWRIIRRLDLDRDQVVPVDELIQAGKVDHAGVRSAIQRVKAELHEVGIGGLIENVRGQGYQLCDFPLLGVSRET